MPVWDHLAIVGRRSGPQASGVRARSRRARQYPCDCGIAARRRRCPPMRRSIASIAALALLLSSVGAALAGEPAGSAPPAPIVGPDPSTIPGPSADPSADPYAGPQCRPAAHGPGSITPARPGSGRRRSGAGRARTSRRPAAHEAPDGRRGRPHEPLDRCPQVRLGCGRHRQPPGQGRGLQDGPHVPHCHPRLLGEAGSCPAQGPQPRSDRRDDRRRRGDPADPGDPHGHLPHQRHGVPDREDRRRGRSGRCRCRDRRHGDRASRRSQRRRRLQLLDRGPDGLA